MSGVEIIGLISAAIEGVKICREIYKTIKDTKDLPAAFHEVNKQLPLAQNTLEKAQRTAEEAIAAGNAGANNLANEGESMLATISTCSKKIEELKKIFRKARDLREDGHPFRKGYRAVVEKMGGTNHRVEELMRGILDSVLSLGANQVFRLATRDQVDKITQAIKELGEVEPSVEESHRAGGNTFTHLGSGNINNEFGDGDMFNVKSGGTVNKAERMNVGHTTGYAA